MIPMKRDVSEENKKFLEIINNHWVMIPNFWDYHIYQEADYEWMCMDMIRNNAYRDAIKKNVKNRIVVEIGTGQDLPLTLMCIESGAKYVYGIETNKEAFEKAQKRIQENGLSNKVTLLFGNSYDMELPEKCDVCVSEIIGSIGSSEGAIAYLKDAKRFMQEDGIMIPGRCVTQIAPVSLPDHLYTEPFIEDMIAHYHELLYRLKGDHFKSNRYLIPNFPPSHLLGKEQVFEDIDFNGDLQLNHTRSSTFSILKESCLDGFLLWINLYIDPHTMIDTLNHKTNWQPVFLPSEKFNLKKNDIIDIICKITPSENTINPNYVIKGNIHRQGVKIHSFAIDSLY